MFQAPTYGAGNVPTTPRPGNAIWDSALRRWVAPTIGVNVGPDGIPLVGALQNGGYNPNYPITFPGGVTNNGYAPNYVLEDYNRYVAQAPQTPVQPPPAQVPATQQVASGGSMDWSPQGQAQEQYGSAPQIAYGNMRRRRQAPTPRPSPLMQSFLGFS